MTLHDDVVGVLEKWQAPDARQEQLRAGYLQHLAEHADGVWRECRTGHVTASCLVVDVEGGRVLLTLHPKVGLWLQTGGHCEPGDASLLDAALREGTEESGIEGLTPLPEPAQLDRHTVKCAGGVSEHLDVQYVMVAPPGAVERASEESLDLRWFAYDELPELTDDPVRNLVARARALLATG